MKITEIVEEIKTGLVYLKEIMIKIQKSDGWAGAAVGVYLFVNTWLINKMSEEFLPTVNLMAFEAGEVAKSENFNWLPIYGWVYVLYYGVPTVVMTALGIIESWTVLRRVNWYRILGVVLITCFLVAVWILSYPLNHSLFTIILGNFVFIPVVCVYVITGFIYAAFRTQ